MAASRESPTHNEKLRRRGRRAGIVVFGVLVAGVTAWWSIQILQQVFAPIHPPLTQPCRQAMLGLLGAVGKAREAAALQRTEKAALQAFRQALQPSWDLRPALDGACRGDRPALHALRAIDELRYAEEHAVRYEALRLARQRMQVNATAELLGAPED